MREGLREQDGRTCDQAGRRVVCSVFILLYPLWKSAARKSKVLFKNTIQSFLTPRFKIPLLQTYKLLKVRKLLQPCSVYRSLKHTHVHTSYICIQFVQNFPVIFFRSKSLNYPLDITEIPKLLCCRQNVQVKKLINLWTRLNTFSMWSLLFTSKDYTLFDHCLRHHSIHHSEYIRELVRLTMGSIFSHQSQELGFYIVWIYKRGKELLLYIG